MTGQHPTRERLIELIRDSGGCTISDLQARTGLSRSTLRQHLAHLLRAGTIRGTLDRRPTGRPPRVYRLKTAGATVPDTYHAFLEALFASMHAEGREAVEAAFHQAAARLAEAHPEIGRLPTLPARIDAARRLFFGSDAGAVERTEAGYQFSISTCPLAMLSLEFADLCRVTRLVLGALVGTDVEQSEWIIRGDPRCTFEVRLAAQPATTA